MTSPENKRQKMGHTPATVGSSADASPAKPEMKDDPTRTVEERSAAAAYLNKEPVFDKYAQNFQQIVKCRGFVDKTLLVKELLASDYETEKNVMIFAPTKFGKTVNLNMIRLFVDIERDADGNPRRDVTRAPTEEELASSEVMKTFRRDTEDSSKWCKILGESELVKEHFGRHPVVFLDLGQLQAESVEEATSGCAKLVRRAYLEHKYLENSSALDDGDAENARDWCNFSEEELAELCETNVDFGLTILCRSLRAHWKRYPILLVDAVDSPAVRAIEAKVSGDEIEMMGSILSDLMFGVLKPNEPMVAAALITGVSHVRTWRFSQLDNTTPVYHLRDRRFSDYYGLTDAEVRHLVNALLPHSDRGDVLEFINKHYNGYHDEEGAVRFCPYSVLSYIDRQHKNRGDTEYVFWSDGGLLGDFGQRLNNPTIMKYIQTLLSAEDDDNSIQIRYEKKIDSSELLGIFDEKQSVHPNEIFSFFLQQGFLAHDSTLRAPSGRQLASCVKIPNLEVKSRYQQMFESYFSGVPVDARIACGEFLRDVSADVHKSAEDVQKFHKELNTIFMGAKCPNERAVSALVYFVTKAHAGYEQCYMEFPVKGSDENGKNKTIGRIDLWAKKEDFCMIWKFKQNRTALAGNAGNGAKSALAALEDIVPPPHGKAKEDPTSENDGKLLKALEQHRIRKYLLVGLSVDGDHKVHVRLLANSQNWCDVVAL